MTRAAAFAMLIATAVGLGGCGKKGDPDYPAGSPPLETRTKPDGTTEKKPTKPSRSFPLDPLLN